jgi:hypothetical protein
MYKMFLIVLMIVSISCAGLSQSNTKYIIIKYSGSMITDVYIIDKCCKYDNIVIFERHGNKFRVADNFKIIETRNPDLVSKYHEYHCN